MHCCMTILYRTLFRQLSKPRGWDTALMRSAYIELDAQLAVKVMYLCRPTHGSELRFLKLLIYKRGQPPSCAVLSEFY
jgi:hypothetical protein